MKKVAAVCVCLMLALPCLPLKAALGESKPGPDAAASPAGPPAGAWADGVYRNEAVDVAYALPEGWRVIPAEELTLLIEVSLRVIMQADGLAEVMENSGSSFDMMTASASFDHCMDILYTDLSRLENGPDMTETDYLALVREQIGGVKRVRAAFGEPVALDAGGQTYTSMTANITVSKYHVRQQSLVRRAGDVMVMITYSTFDGRKPETLDWTDALTGPGAFPAKG